jgi:hypothetical protein
MDTVYVTYVSGESPNPSDSGFSFARRAKKLLGISEDRIVHHPDLLSLILAGVARNVVFVDDFAGTGNQFLTTWRRPYQVPAGPILSFERASPLRGLSFYYCPVLCAELGARRIHTEAPRVGLYPAHVLPASMSVFSPDSRVWPIHLRSTATSFIQRASARAGLPDYGGTKPGDWRGFAALGLTVALASGTPDATIPLFTTTLNGWKPLVTTP